MEHINIKIYGRVQGVGFRYSTKNKAKELGVFGFVKNMDDVSVYVEAEGDEESLKELLNWCHKGSSCSKIRKVEYNYVRKLENFNSFEVKYD